VVTLHRDQGQVQGRRQQEVPTEAAQVDEQAKAADRPHPHHREVVRLGQRVRRDGARLGGQEDEEADRQAETGDDEDRRAVDEPPTDRLLGRRLEPTVGEVGGADEDDQGHVGEQHGTLEFLRPDDIECGVVGVHRAGAVEELPGTDAEAIGVEKEVGRGGMPERQAGRQENDAPDQEDRIEEEIRQQGGHVSGSS